MANFKSSRSLINKRTDMAKALYTNKQRHKEYKQIVKKSGRRIITATKELRKIEELINRIRSLGNAVAMFTGVNVKNSPKNIANSPNYRRITLAKSIFYKYGLEHRIPAKDLREYVGASRTLQPTEYRKNFTNSFRDNPENKQQWENFKQYYSNQKPCTDDFTDKKRATQ